MDANVCRFEWVSTCSHCAREFAFPLTSGSGIISIVSRAVAKSWSDESGRNCAELVRSERVSLVAARKKGLVGRIKISLGRRAFYCAIRRRMFFEESKQNVSFRLLQEWSRKRLSLKRKAFYEFCFVYKFCAYFEEQNDPSSKSARPQSLIASTVYTRFSTTYDDEGEYRD